MNGGYQQYPGSYTCNGGYQNGAYQAQPGPYATQAYDMPFVYPQDNFQNYQHPQSMQEEEVPPLQLYTPANWKHTLPDIKHI